MAENDSLEPAFRAQVLEPPSEADIAREIGRDVDPDAIHRARERVRAEIATGEPALPRSDRLAGAGGYHRTPLPPAGARSPTPRST